jgi:hypothetical protein
MIMRRAALIAAGLVMAAGVGVAGAGTASATELKIHNDAVWTMRTSDGGCELEQFASNGTFTSGGHNDGDAGKWSGGEGTIKMTWTTGDAAGLKFKGTYAAKAYSGSLNQPGGTGELLKGAAPSCT